jgi:hypothetical protein
MVLCPCPHSIGKLKHNLYCLAISGMNLSSDLSLVGAHMQSKTFVQPQSCWIEVRPPKELILVVVY